MVSGLDGPWFPPRSRVDRVTRNRASVSRATEAGCDETVAGIARGKAMIPNIFFATTIVFIAIGFFLLQECNFLIPYRSLLMEKYGHTIAVFAALLFLNLFALIYLLVRKIYLKDTGRKLAHVEKQIRTGESISDELSRRLSKE
jgi:hypothetical protein